MSTFLPNLPLIIAFSLVILVLVKARSFVHYTLRTKLILAFILVVAVSIATVSRLNNVLIQRQLTEDVGLNLQDLAQSKAQAVGDLLAKQVDTLEALSVNRILQDGLAQRTDSSRENLSTNPDQIDSTISEELLGFRNKFPDNYEVLLTDATGTLAASTNTTAVSNFQSELWWQTAYRDGRGDLYLGSDEATGDIIIAVPVYGRQQQKVVGILRTTFALNSLLDVLRYEEKGHVNRVDLLMPADNLLLVKPNGLTMSDPGTRLSAGLAQLQSGEADFLSLPYEGQTSLVSLAPVNTTDPSSRLPVAHLNWSIISHQNEAEALQAVEASLQATAVTGLAALLLTGLLAIFLARLMSRPVERLTAVMQQVIAGDMNARADESRGDEFGTLAHTFNQMTSQLNQTMTAVTQRTQMLQTSADVARAASASLNLNETLSTTVEHLVSQFEFYHASVFLVEPKSGIATLKASTSEALKAEEHHLDINGRSLVGYAIRNRKPTVVQDTEKSADHYKNPSLPLTRSEATFPLIVGDDVLGVLDVQSKTLHAFDPEMTTHLQTLADQVAVAVQHAQLYEEQKKIAAHYAEVDQMKNEFIANMSHELRTPLNSIIGFTTIILNGIDGPLNKQQEEDLRLVASSGRHLLSIINNLLDLSRIGAGKLDLHYETVNLNEIIDDVISITTALIQNDRITLRQFVPADLPVIEADTTRVRQILLNILANAAKFTLEGGIIVTADHDAETVTIQVNDTGIGIPHDKLGTIFEEFTQADSSQTRSFEGTGLGLPITKNLVEMHHGQLWVESTVGIGSTFYVKLPIQQPQANSADDTGKEIVKTAPIPAGERI